MPLLLPVPAEADGDAPPVALAPDPDPSLPLPLPEPVAVAVAAPSGGNVAVWLSGGVIPAEAAAKFEIGGPGNTYLDPASKTCIRTSSAFSGAKCVSERGGAYRGVEDSRVVVVVSTRERYGVRRGASTATTDTHLRARRVELGSTHRHCEVESDDLQSALRKLSARYRPRVERGLAAYLVTDEIVAWGKILGECDSVRVTVHYNT